MNADPARASFENWQSAASGWERRSDWFQASAGPLTERMVDQLGPRPGQTVLELAAGIGDTGFRAASILGPTGLLISSDFSPNMVEAARRRAAGLGIENVDFRVIDATRIPLGDDSVDGVLCRFGFMLMTDPAAALQETRRVLRPGGRLVFVVWTQPEQNAWTTIPRRIMAERGLVEQPPPGAPDMFGLGEPATLERLIGAAGLSSPAFEEVALEWRYDGAGDYWTSLLDLSSAIAAALEPLGVEEREEIRKAVLAEVESLGSGDGLRLPALCLLVTTSA